MADFDGDILQVITNSNFIESILPEPKRYFYNILSEETKAKKVLYKTESRIRENIFYSGNLIGSIAVLGASINDRITEEKFFNGKEIISYIEAYRRNEYSKEKTDNFLILNGYKKIQDVFTEEELRAYYAKQFHENRKKVYKTVELSMVAIDSPKTGIIVDTEEINCLKKVYKKPMFMSFLVDKNIDYRQCSNHRSTLNDFNRYVYEQLILPFKEENSRILNPNICSHDFLFLMKGVQNLNVDTEKSNELYNILKQMILRFNQTKAKMLKGEVLKTGFNNDEDNNREFIKEQVRIYKNCVGVQVEEILKDYDICTVSYTVFKILANIKAIDFSVEFLWKYIIFAIKIENDTISYLFKNENGKYDGLFGSYDLITRTSSFGVLEEKILKEQNKKRVKLLNDFSFRIKKLSDIDLNNKKVIIKNNQVLFENKVVGEIFIDSLAKQNLNLNSIQGEYTVSLYVPNLKSAKIIIQ